MAVVLHARPVRSLMVVAIVVLASVVMIAGAGAAGQPPPPAAARQVAPLSSVIEKPELTSAERAIVDWGKERFASAGLVLPYVVVSFHTDREACRGNEGTYRPGSIGRIWICRTSDGSPSQEHHLRHALLHELAHAWADHYLDDHTRDAFMADRHATNWNDRTELWHDRGTEQAAEIMTWGLMDAEITFLAIDDKGCERLRQGFVLLTGVEPVAGVQYSC